MIPKKILLLSYTHEGGEWIATSRLISAFKDAYPNYEFYLLFFDNNNIEDLVNFKQKFFIQHAKVNGSFNFSRTLLKEFSIVRKEIVKISEKVKFDFIISTHYLMFLSAKSIIPKGNGAFFLFHGIKTNLDKKFTDLDHRQILLKLLESLALFFANIIIVPSNSAKGFILKTLWKFGNEKKIYIIPNFVPKEFFARIPAQKVRALRKEMGIPLNAKIVLYSGRIAKFKGLENLINAFAKFSTTHKNTFLIIAYPVLGVDKCLLDKLKERISYYNINKIIKFVSNSKLKKLVSLYQMSDVLILPSELEFAPLSIIESLASGTPSIVTKQGNMEEILTKIDPSLILKNYSPKEINNKLEYFFSLPHKKLEAIKKISISTAKTYSPEVSVQRFLYILKSLKTR